MKITEQKWESYCLPITVDDNDDDDDKYDLDIVGKNYLLPYRHYGRYTLYGSTYLERWNTVQE